MISLYWIIAVGVLLLLFAGLACIVLTLRVVISTRKADERWKQFDERYEYRDRAWRKKK